MIDARARGLLVAGLCGVWGCREPQLLRGRIQGLEEVLQQARRRGALRCAPQELAVAEAQLEFAKGELAQGDPGRAAEHVSLAEPNVRAAKRLSPPGGICVGEVGDRDGDGLLDRHDACASEAEDLDGYEDEDGCPDDQDLDGDRVGDAIDLCPAEPEDWDGFLDQDGCPELDNDGDGLPDGRDGCPLEAEDPDGYQDDDGCRDADNDGDGLGDVIDRCPDEPGPEADAGCPRLYRGVRVTADKVVITEQVLFRSGRAVIQPVSFGLLDTVAEALRDHPEVEVEVQAHTDSQGPDRQNQKLSEARAEAVREYLVGQGVAAQRMTAHGYGESRPIDSNSTASGRAANRRVEFVRIDPATHHEGAR